MTDPYAPPTSSLDSNEDVQEPVGFWLRLVASLLDGILLLIVILPITWLIYGEELLNSDQVIAGFWDGVLNYLFPAAASLVFWRVWGATPGKMAVGARIVDADTGGRPSTGHLIGRYFAYIPSALVLLLGYFWVAWDKRKQGWHDKLAGTLVVRRR